MKRGLVAVVLLAAAFLLAWWWTSPNDAWACGSADTTSGCVSQVGLDLSGLDIDDPVLRFKSLALHPNGTQVAVSINSGVQGQDERVVLAVFDTTSGEQRQTLLALDDPAVARVENVVYSPDGSLIAGAVSHGRFADIVVFDAASGDEQGRILSNDGDWTSVRCAGRFGISPDNTELQCGSGIFALSDGRPLRQLDDENAYADFSGGFAWSRSGLTAEISADVAIVTQLDEVSTVQLTPVASGDGHQRSFSPDDEFLVDSVRYNTGLAWTSPRRSRPGGVIRIIDMAAQQQVSTIELEIGFERTEWSNDGTHLVGITDDLEVTVFRLG